MTILFKLINEKLALSVDGETAKEIAVKLQKEGIKDKDIDWKGSFQMITTSREN